VPFHTPVLFVSAALVLWVAARVARRPGTGVRQFLWLSAAIALWCLTAGAHALTPDLETKVRWSQLQYVGIATLAPLWLQFAASYAGRPWFSGHTWQARARRTLFWVFPAATVVVAASNPWHRVLWTDVSINADGLAVYAHGWWFWAYAAYSYLLLAIGTGVIVHTLRQSPPPLRGQSVALLAASIIPWAGNLVYLTASRNAGIDPTPLAFTASGILFALALYRTQLFDLVPVARDVVIESLSDGMLVLDPTWRILDMNSAAREVIRHHGAAGGSADAIGRPLDRVLPMLGGAALEPDAGAPTVIATAGEPPVFFDVRVVPVRSRTEVRGAGWVVLLRDVTTQRMAAAERDRLQERMQEQQRRESLSILAAGLAHDFNNLLTGIVGNADLLAMQIPASSKMGHNVGAILLGAQRAADLVSKMLAYAGERHGSTSRVDIDALTHDLLELLRASAARHCVIEYHGQPTIIEADPTQIRQVAMNLIINAAEAVSDAGTIRISVGRQTLTAAELSRMRVGREAPPGAYAFLEVRDDGAGIDPAVERRLFQPFFTTKPSGHGLGLAAVQGIVIGHRGALRVDSRPGHGTRFCVWLPLANRQGVTPDAELETDDEAGAAVDAPGLINAPVS
jgi:signal transduction histidine kinase